MDESSPAQVLKAFLNQSFFLQVNILLDHQGELHYIGT